MLFCDITLYMNCCYLGRSRVFKMKSVLKARLIEKLVREAAPTTSVWLMNTSSRTCGVAVPEQGDWCWECMLEMHDD